MDVNAGALFCVSKMMTKRSILPKIARVVCLAAVAVALAAAKPAALAHASHLRQLDLARSRITVSVYKQGLFAFAADNHTVDAPISAGWFDETTKAVQLTVDATKMRVLDPSMPADRRAHVQANMVGPAVLDVAKYPAIEFRSTAVTVDAGGSFKVVGNLTLHGQTRAETVTVQPAGANHFTGKATVRQTDFGITPIRIAAGTVRVKDDVDISFDITLR